MTFHYRKFNKALDMNIINKFLRLREQREYDGTFLPPTGVIVFMEDLPCCAGFMIKCDNGMAINSDLISDPTIPKEIRNEAVQYMREVLYGIARQEGLKITTVFTKHERLLNKLKGMGYVEVDRGLTQLGRIL